MNEGVTHTLRLISLSSTIKTWRSFWAFFSGGGGEGEVFAVQTSDKGCFFIDDWWTRVDILVGLVSLTCSFAEDRAFFRASMIFRGPMLGDG